MQRWWQTDPDRYDAELKALDAAGIPYEIDQAELEKGRLVLNVKYPREGEETLPFTVTFAWSHPDFRPDVAAPANEFPYHQNPGTKTVCLLPQPTREWNPEQLLADYLREQVPKLLEAVAAKSGDDVAHLEVGQAEPRSAYYTYVPGTVVLIDGAWRLDPAIPYGELTIGFWTKEMRPREIIQKGLRGAVLDIRDDKGDVVLRAPEEVRELVGAQPFRIPWIRLPAPPDLHENGAIGRYVREVAPHFDKRIRDRLASGREVVLAITFPEESRRRVAEGEGWVFLAHPGGKGASAAQKPFYYVPAERAGPHDMVERIPELRALGSKKVAVVGAGCVGAPSILEFARAGVGELRFLDHDDVSAGTACRWPLGLAFAQLPKVEALDHFIRQNFPYVRNPYLRKEHRGKFMIGSPHLPFDELEELDAFLSGIDLVYDASAEEGVQSLLSRMAWRRSIPYVLIETRPGGWGGLVARLRPWRGSGCFLCFRHALVDGTIDVPIQKEEVFIQPQGCISPTFTAAGFDVAEVSLAGVRLAVSTLCEGVDGGYPAAEDDVGVLSLRGSGGTRSIFPQWKGFKMSRHRRCPWCWES